MSAPTTTAAEAMEIADVLEEIEWSFREDYRSTPHNSHKYDGMCAICRGDLPALVVATLRVASRRGLGPMRNQADSA